MVPRLQMRQYQSISVGSKGKTRTHVTETGREKTGPDDSFVRDVVSHALQVVVNAEESSKLLKSTYNCIRNGNQQNFIPYEPSALHSELFFLYAP